MGLCASNGATAAQKEANRSLESQLHADRVLEKRNIKLLFLGAGESGKSTLLKQLLLLYGTGFDHDTQQTYTETIHRNVVASLHALISYQKKMSNMETPVDLDKHVAHIHEVVDKEAHEQQHFRISKELAESMDAIWRWKGVRAVWLHERNKFQIDDSAAYFLDKIFELAQPEWKATEEDIIRARVRTTGIVHQQLLIEGVEFNFIDVGGQRNERKKWIHCFDAVTGVLFVVAASAYDQDLFEDESVNRLDEALRLFEEYVEAPWFKDAAFILFLNKCDLLKEKLEWSPIENNRHFSKDEFKGDTKDLADVKDHMKGLFLERAANREDPVHIHFTTATSKDNVAHIFNAVKDVIVRRSLKDSGLSH